MLGVEFKRWNESTMSIKYDGWWVLNFEHSENRHGSMSKWAASASGFTCIRGD